MKMEGILKILTTLQSIMFKVISEHIFIFIFLIYYLLNLLGDEIFNLVLFDFMILHLKTAARLFLERGRSRNYPFTQALFSNWNIKSFTILRFAKRTEFQKGILISDYIHSLYLSCIHCQTYLYILSMSSHIQVVLIALILQNRKNALILRLFFIFQC